MLRNSGDSQSFITYTPLYLPAYHINIHLYRLTVYYRPSDFFTLPTVPNLSIVGVINNRFLVSISINFSGNCSCGYSSQNVPKLSLHLFNFVCCGSIFRDDFIFNESTPNIIFCNIRYPTSDSIVFDQKRIWVRGFLFYEIAWILARPFILLSLVGSLFSLFYWRES